MEKQVIRTEAAPAPFQGAPYNQAIVAGGLVFTAGQLGLKPGDTAVGGDITQQTEQALANVQAILEAAGSSMDNLVKTSVFLVDLDDFQAMNAVYAARVGDRPPDASAGELTAKGTINVRRLLDNRRQWIDEIYSSARYRV